MFQMAVQVMILRSKPQVLVSVNDDHMGQKSPINAEKIIFLPYTNIIHKVNFYTNSLQHTEVTQTPAINASFAAYFHTNGKYMPCVNNSV